MWLKVVSLHVLDSIYADYLSAPNTLGAENLDFIKTFDFFIQNKPSIQMYQDMQRTYVLKDMSTRIPSLKEIWQCMLALSALKPLKYHCCKNSCIWFTGYLHDLAECPYCRTPCLNPAGNPYSIFSYIPIIPQLHAAYHNQAMAQKLHYWAKYRSDGNDINDIFNGDYYKELQDTFVTINGEEQPYWFFEDDWELALGLSVDGMCPFKWCKNTCWPLILINYNLPPEIWTHIQNIYCVSVIPGPHSPANINVMTQGA